MAIRVPTPPQMQVGAVQEQVTARAFQNVQYRPDDFMGRQLSQLGQATSALGQRIDAARTDTALLEAQQAINAKRRELFDPENGIYARQGANAVGVTDLVDQELTAFSDQILSSKKLSGSGREAVQRMLMAERQRAYESAASFELSATQRYQEQLQAANLDAQYDRLFRNPGNPAERDAAFTSIFNAVSDRADQLGFADDELRAQYIEEEVTKGILAVADGYAVVDPVMADAFLEANADRADPQVIQQRRAQLKPQVVEAKAREEVSRAVQADRSFGIKARDNVNHGTQIDFEMGPLRPNAPNKPLLNIIGTAVTDVLGPGARVVVTSGQGTGNASSGRHLHGNAADIKVYRADGSLVTMGSSDMKSIAVAAAGRGALGIGFGYGDMGDAMHVDMVNPDPGKGQDHAWGQADAMQSEIVAAMQSGEEMVNKTGLEVIMDIEDPDVRDAALTRYRQEQNANYTTRVRASEEAALSIIEQMRRDQEAGSLKPQADYLNPATREVLGGNVNSVMSTYESIALGRPSDPVKARQVYAFLQRQANSGSVDERMAFATMNLELASEGQLSADQMSTLYAQQIEVAASLGLTADNQLVTSNTTGIAYNDFRTAVTQQMGTKASGDAEAVSRNTAALIDWATVYKNTNGKDPTDIELASQARKIMYGGDITANPSGARNQLSGTLNEVYKQIESRETTLGDLRGAAQNGEFKLALPSSTGQLVEVPITAQMLDRLLAKFPSGYAGMPMTPRLVVTLLANMDPYMVDQVIAQQGAGVNTGSDIPVSP